MSGLNKRATQYHVHEFPIDADETSRCNHVNLGAPLDPYNVTKVARPALGTDTADKYEVGDMSGKYGLLTNKTTFQKTVSDPSLHIFGLKTITGRSILIHNDKGAGLACADIIPADAILFSATVNFTSTATSVLTGAAKLRQYIQSNGAVTQMIVVINLKYKADSSTKTPDHNWHTHILPVGKVVGVCSSITGNYNPTKVSVAKPPYSSQCDGRHPYRCEVGDTSAKVGKYSIGGKAYYADVDGPLFGSHTSFGRSITFHKKNGAAPRLACADIVPDIGNGVAKFEIDITFDNSKG